MKSIRNRAYSLTIIAVIFLFIIFSITGLISKFGKHVAYAQENQEILIDGYDFSDNSILVTMDKDVGGVNKIHDKSYFGDIAVTAITDLTYRENVANVDLDRFKQILKLELQYHDKNYVQQAVEEISKLKGVEAVTPNYFGEFCATANDTDYSRQWGLQDINIESAWDITTGSKAIRVGVIDTGIAPHPDLIDNLASGWNFVDNNSNTNDTDGHGTHVAGIIGAVGDNNAGISGVCKNVELVPLKISNVIRPWKEEYVIEAINYADELWGTIEQIDLLNFSGGGFSDNINFYNAINNFRGLFVDSAGNNGNDIDSAPYYPASFVCDNLVTVGAIDSNGKRRESSNYGKNTVDIYAPGESIYSTYTSNRYVNMSGTSMAAPHVTGVAALLLSKSPTLTAAELKEAILEGADDITISIKGGNQDVKKLNAYKALQTLNKVTFDKQGGQGGDDYVYARRWSDMPAAKAPTRMGYIFDGYYSGPNGTGTQYYSPSMLSAHFCNFEKQTTLYAHWEPKDYNAIVSWTHLEAERATRMEILKVQFDQTYTLTADETMTITKKVDQKQVTRRFSRWSIILGGEAKFDINTNPWIVFSTDLTITFNLNEIVEKYYPNFTDEGIIELRAVYAGDRVGSCVAEGTLITLADGKQVPVEQLTGDETLLVWNLFTGTFDTAPILCIDSEPAAMNEIINLYFSDGTTVKVISEHGFWNLNLNEYVYLGYDASQYIGHWFNKQTTDENNRLCWTEVQLTNVAITEEYTTAWSPVTYGHLCYYVNGMLSMPGGIEGLFNIFEVDSQTLKYDETAYLQDIETYGLYTYEEFAEILPVSKELFEAVNGQYLKVAIGKGLIDLDTIEKYINQYSALFS